jgi:hypothetical protein
MAAPRIGRADRLEALRAGRPARVFTRDIFGAADQRDLATLLRPSPLLDRQAPTTAPSPTPVAVGEAAEQLAQELEPLPGALRALALRINRHCAVAGRDAELRDAVDAVRARTFAIACAVHRLAEAAGREERR